MKKTSWIGLGLLLLLVIVTIGYIALDKPNGIYVYNGLSENTLPPENSTIEYIPNVSNSGTNSYSP